MEALWREALWLIKDDICDVETLDDVIRYSFGLRWAQMGLFQTYRIAGGGEAGMRHFLAQFGPCLKWPWTRLTDVVDLDGRLVEKIGSQSDEQAAGLSIRELERIRDENLIGVMQALKASRGGEGWGAGKLLADFEQRLLASASPPAVPDLTAPLRLVETKVSAAWIDYNGYMSEHRYLQVFGDTTDGLLRLIGVDMGHAETGASYYTVESHLRHLDEARLGEALTSTCQILWADEKRIHVFHRLFAGTSAREIATAEQMLNHGDRTAGCATPAPAAILERVKAIATAHARLERPLGAGRIVDPLFRALREGQGA